MKNTSRFQTAAPLAAFALTASLAQAATVIDFEGDEHIVGTFPSGWSLAGSDNANVDVVTTTDSGSYVGGKAIRTIGTGDSTFAGFLVTQPGINGLQFDVNWNVSTNNTPVLVLYGWDDSNSNNAFESGEREVGFSMDNDGIFKFQAAGAGPELAGDTATSFVANTWYRLTLTWTDPDLSGNRDLTLSGFNLSGNTDLGVVNTVTMTSAQFGVDPSLWDGVAFRMTRGTIDNITLIPEPSTALLGGIGALLLLRRRR